DDRVDRTWGQASAASIDEDRPARDRPPAEVRVEGSRGRRAVRHHALFAALAEDSNGPRVAIERVDVETRELGHPQAGGIEHLEHGHVALARLAADPVRVDHGIRLVAGQERHELSRRTRRPYLSAGVALHRAVSREKAIETAHRR